MAKYFTKITADHWVEKNKAHKDMLAFFRTKDATLIHSDKQKSAFIEDLKEGAMNVNLENKRCKDIVLNVWNPTRSNETIASASGIVVMHIYPVKSEM